MHRTYEFLNYSTTSRRLEYKYSSKSLLRTEYWVQRVYIAYNILVHLLYLSTFAVLECLQSTQLDLDVLSITTLEKFCCRLSAEYRKCTESTVIK